MFAAFRSRRSRPTRLARRIALFALLSLQCTIALAPLMEPDHEAPSTHVERTGTTHHFVVHDDATCAVCALRSLRALPSGGAPVLATAAPARFADSRGDVMSVVRDEAAHSTRAPPVIG